MPRAKLLDAKPRGRMSAYAFFVQSCREEHKKKHPDKNVVFADFSRKCADRWKVMDTTEKQHFHELAEKDKHRFDNEMTSYAGPRVARQRKRRQRKDPNAPKRALSGFFWFSVDERPRVRIDYPDYGAAETAKELGFRWANIDPALKDKYEQMAAKDRERYNKEMKLFKAGSAFGAKRQKTDNAAAAVEGNGKQEDEDDEEDEEDDDDEEEHQQMKSLPPQQNDDDDDEDDDEEENESEDD